MYDTLLMPGSDSEPQLAVWKSMIPCNVLCYQAMMLPRLVGLCALLTYDIFSES
jgi:hypothetical protein